MRVACYLLCTLSHVVSTPNFKYSCSSLIDEAISREYIPGIQKLRITRDLCFVLFICFLPLKSKKNLGITKGTIFADNKYHRPAVPNLGYAILSSSLILLMKMPPHNSLGGTRYFCFLFGGTRAEKGWEPLL